MTDIIATPITAVPKKRRRFPVKRFSFFFLLLTGLGIGWMLFDVGDVGKVWAVLGKLTSSPTIVCLLAVFLLLDWYTDYLRYHYIAKHLGMQIDFKLGIRLVFANLFFAYLTPGGTFGAPVVVYMLYKRGEQITKAIALALIKPFLLFFLLLASGCLIFPFVELPQIAAVRIVPDIPLMSAFAMPLEQEIMASWAVTRQVMLLSSIVVLVLTLFVASMVFYPAFAQRIFDGLITRLRARVQASQPGVDTPRLDRWQRNLHATLQAFALFGKSGWRGIIDGLITTFLNLFFYMVLSVVLLHGLGFGASLTKLWFYSYVYYFLIAFAPTPGGSGVAEGGGYLFFQSLAAPEVVTSYVLMWRFLTCYLVILVGAGLFIQFIRRMRLDELEELQDQAEKTGTDLASPETLAAEKRAAAF